MSHAFAVRGARQTAVLAAIIGLHFAVFLAVTAVRDSGGFVDPGPSTITVLPEPPKPEPRAAPPQPGPIEGPDLQPYPEPKFPLPEFKVPQPRVEPVPGGTVGGVAGAGPTVVVVPPALKTRPANVAAAINACYPAASRRLNEEGKVVALVTISASGSAVNWSVAQSSGFARLDAAIACVLSKVVFVAGRRDGQAVFADATLPIVFQLD